MIYCVNPVCPKRHNPEDASHCLTCGTSLLVHNRYCLLRRLHDSEVKEVFEVEDVVDNDTKILKIVKAFPNIDFIENHIERIQREARTLIGLNLPSVPRVALDGYFTLIPAQGAPSIHCLAMEKIEGQDLKQWIETHGPISADLALQWLKQLVEVIDQVHQEKFIHRDIEPSNIIRRPNGTLALIDFDTVCSTTETALSDSDITAVLTVCYAAPEQYQNRICVESDFYSLGRTFVYLLTGKSPCDLETNNGQLIWKNKVDRSTLCASDRRISDSQINHFFDLIEQFLDYKVESRLRDVDEIKAKISGIEQNSQEKSKSDFLLFSKEKFIRVSAGAGLLMLGFMFGWGISRLDRDSVEQIVSEITPGSSLSYPCTWDAVDLTDIDVNFNETHLAYTSSDGNLRVQSIIDQVSRVEQENSNSTCFEFKGHSKSAIAVRFRPGNSQMIATAGLDGTVQILEYDPGSGEIVRHVYQLWNNSIWNNSSADNSEAIPIVNLEFSPDGRFLAVADKNGKIKIWDIDDENNLVGETQLSSYITSLSFSPNNNLLAIASLASNPAIWNFGETNEILEIPHENALNVKFSPNREASELATFGNDGILKIWDAEDLEPLVNPLNTGLRIVSIEFNSDGQRLFILPSGTTPSHQPRMWNWRTSSVLNIIPESSDPGSLYPGDFADEVYDREPVKLQIIRRRSRQLPQLIIAKTDGVTRFIRKE